MKTIILKKILINLTALFFPERCAFCGMVTSAGEHTCTQCKSDLPVVSGIICKTCGCEKVFCSCKKKHFEFNCCLAPFYYEGIAKRGVLRYKFGNKQSSVRAFAIYAAEIIRREYFAEHFDFVTAVPMSKAEFRNRGFNQSEAFGIALAKELTLEFRKVLSKPFDTKPQRSCSATNRWGNVFGTFSVTSSLDGKRVLLVDDIMTTGATLNECAKMLKLAGATEVFCTVIASVKKY